MVQYSIHGNRREISFGTYPQLSLADANGQAAIFQADVKNGIDTLAEKKCEKGVEFKTVNDLADDWLSLQRQNLMSFILQSGFDIYHKRETKQV